MRDFVITVNSTVDMPKEWLEEKNVPYLKLTYTMEGETYKDMSMDSKDFFDRLRAGQMPVTSQVNPEEAKAFFEPFIEEGKDILHLAFSSGLSGTCQSMMMAGRELAEEYPEAKIIVIDSLCACMGEALLLMQALELKEAGKTIDEIAEWIENHKLNVVSLFTVDDLHHLKRGGRVSAVSAIIGTAIKIKPVLHMNMEGKLEVLGKERGRKKALNAIVELAKEKSGSWKNERMLIAHGDCIEDAEYTATLLKDKLGVKDVYINSVGTVIGSHTGPGLISLFLMGDER